MKKQVLIVLVILLINICVFSASIADSSIGFAYYTYNEDLRSGSETYSWSEKRNAISGNADIMLFGYDSNHGIDLGFTFLYPLSSKIDGEEVETSTADSDWGFRLGTSRKYLINDSLTLVSSAGYQFLMNICHFDDDNTVVWSRTIVHGVFFQDKLIFKLEDSLTINFGAMLIIPWFGTVTFSPEGSYSERFRTSFRGVIINPFLGFNLRM